MQNATLLCDIADLIILKDLHHLEWSSHGNWFEQKHLSLTKKTSSIKHNYTSREAIKDSNPEKANKNVTLKMLKPQKGDCILVVVNASFKVFV